VRKMSGRFRAMCETSHSIAEQSPTFVPKAPARFEAIRFREPNYDAYSFADSRMVASLNSVIVPMPPK
jgi:hypothetical protein